MKKIIISNKINKDKTIIEKRKTHTIKRYESENKQYIIDDLERYIAGIIGVPKGTIKIKRLDWELCKENLE